jgi:hypothetical protein
VLSGKASVIRVKLPLATVIAGVRVDAAAGPVTVTMLPETVAEYPVAVILLLMSVANAALELPDALADRSCKPPTVMLLTVVAVTAGQAVVL